MLLFFMILPAAQNQRKAWQAAQPTQKINPVRYGLSGNGHFSGQKLRKSVSLPSAELTATLR
jgi:hypothetical protein